MRGLVIASMWAILAAALAGCSGARTVCEKEAAAPQGTVAGAFDTTVGRVRGISPGVDPPWAPELPASSPAVVCYIDYPPGVLAMPGPAPDKPADRAIIAIAGSHDDMIVIGNRDTTPVVAP